MTHLGIPRVNVVSVVVVAIVEVGAVVAVLRASAVVETLTGKVLDGLVETICGPVGIVEGPLGVEWAVFPFGGI